ILIMEKIYIQLICTALLSAISGYLILPQLIRYFKRSASLDIPNHRSSHSIPTPTMGGLSFFSGLVFAIVFQPSFEAVFVCSMISLAGVLGWIDDYKGLSPKLKFLGQAIIATCLFTYGFSMSPLIEIMFGLGVPIYVDWFLTVFFMVGVINAFNLIDGVDGMLIGLTFISSLTLLILFLMQGQYSYSILSACIVGISFTFLIFNFQPAKIFMGDTGSLLIGTYISLSVLKVVESQNEAFSTVAMSLILLACVDMFRLFLGRYVILKKPFLADRNHIHHILIRLGWTHKKIVLHAYGFQVLLITFSVFISGKNSSVICMVILISMCIVQYGLLQFMLFRKLQSAWQKTSKKKKEKIGDNQLLESHLK
ncbi:MAG: MraY family glycosyltransferase, partial [Crocinitomicaceae bacterium]|nr:MraY family glycosyltransferase [Crocinitomicaceae bacterium]